jgi:hypothetical protein
MFSQREQSETEYSGDYALQAVPPDLKIRQLEDICFRIFIGCSKENVFRLPHTVMQLNNHITVNSLLPGMW